MPQSNNNTQSDRRIADHAVVTATASLADSDDTTTVHGVAIGANELTNGKYGLKKWPADELQQAASSLTGHEVTYLYNDPTKHGGERIGRVTDAGYQEGVGVLYEATLDDPDVADDLSLGQLDVSIEAANASGVDTDDETGADILRDFDFEGLAVVERGAAPSNYTAAGPAEENPAVAALSAGDIEGMLNNHQQDATATDINVDDPSTNASSADTTADESDADDGSDDNSDATTADTAVDVDSDTGDDDDTPSDDAALQSTQTHTPSYSSTTDNDANFADGSWGSPDMEDFDTDDLSEIDDHFLASTSGFPPESYSDLMLPVVEPDGTLNLNGLRAANQRLPQSHGLNDDQQQSVESTINRLAEDEFDVDWSDDDDSDSENAAANTENESESSLTIEDVQDEIDRAMDGIRRNDQSPYMSSNSNSTSDDTPNDEDASNADPNDQPDRANLNLDGEVIMEESRADELKEAEQERNDLQEENAALKDSIQSKDDRIDELQNTQETLADEAAATLAELGPHTEAFYADLSPDTVLAELGEITDTDDLAADTDNLSAEATGAAALAHQQAANAPDPQPQSGDGSVNPDPEAGPAAELSADEAEAANDTARAALRLDDTTELAQSDDSPYAFVKDRYGEDPAEYTSDIALRETIYDDNDAANGGDH